VPATALRQADAVAAHPVPVEPPREEGAGVVEFLRRAQQHGVYVSNNALERLLGED